MDKLRGAFGKAPASFHLHVERVLQDRRAKKTPARRRLPRVALITALSLLLLAGTAASLTLGFGVLDFQARVAVSPLPSATSMVVNLGGIPGVETSLVYYTVRDAALDGDRFMITLEIAPKHPQSVMLLPFERSPLDPVDHTGESYLSMAKRTGKQLLQVSYPAISVNGMSGHGGTANHMIEGDALRCYEEMYGIESGSDGLLQVRCSLICVEVLDAFKILMEDGGEQVHTNRGSAFPSVLEFEMQTESTELGRLRFEGPIECGLTTINFIEMRRTPMATYMKVRYTLRGDLIGQALQSVQSMYFAMVENPDDETHLQAGPSTVRFISDPSPDGPYAGAVMEEDTIWPAMEAFPATIILRPYYALEDAWGDPILLDAAGGTEPSSGTGDII